MNVAGASEYKGLYAEDIDKEKRILLDPDNVFWGIIKKNGKSGPLIPRKLLSLYEKVKDKCGQQMKHLRFDASLTAIYIDPTDLCNANCPYCYVPAGIRAKGRSMTEKELDFVLNKIAAYFSQKRRTPVIVFHASEPLLVKDIVFDAIAKFSSRFKFGIQTNAILMERKGVEFLKKHRVGIGISLDSNSASLNNRLRPALGRGGNFSFAVRAIEWFKGYAGLNVITTVTKFNVKTLPDLVKFLHAKRVPCVLLNPVRLTQKNSRPLKADTGLLTKYFIKAVDAALKLSEKTKQSIVIGNFANIILGVISPPARRLMCDISPCGGGRCFLTITASGEMIPCGEFIGLEGFSGGNIFKDSIETAMESNAFKRVRSRFVEKIAECDKCALRNLCGAPCPAELHSLGNMYEKAVFCEFYQAAIRHAFKIIAEGKEKYALRKDGLQNLEYTYKLE